MRDINSLHTQISKELIYYSGGEIVVVGKMVCSGIMGALSRLLSEALKIAEEKNISLEEAINMIMSENHDIKRGDSDVAGSGNEEGGEIHDI
jgi:hypothetical protein